MGYVGYSAVYTLPLAICKKPLQIVWTQIRPNQKSGLICLDPYTACHTDASSCKIKKKLVDSTYVLI